jgi:hypothetical protein
MMMPISRATSLPMSRRRAPNNLRSAISRVRRCTASAASTYAPKAAMIIAMTVAMPSNFASRASSA